MSSILQAIVDEKLPNSDEELLKIAALHGENLDAENFWIVLVGKDRKIQTCEQYQSACIDLPHWCRRFFKKHGIHSAVETDCAGICIIVLMDIQQQKLVEKICHGLLDYLEKHQIMDATISVGVCVETPSRLSYSYRTAVNALNYQSLYSGERCLFCEDMQSMLNLTTLQSVIDPDRMLQAFQAGDMDELRLLVTTYAEKVRSLSGGSIEGRHPTSIRRMFIELTVYVLHIASDMGVDVDKSLKGLDPYNYLLANDKSTPIIIDWFISMCSDLRSAINEKAKNKEQSIIQQVCDYIEEHITQYGLSLDDAAMAVNMTSSYISKLFRKEMGIGFSKYVAQKRLKIAGKLLSETELSVKDISEQTGFSSANYFGTSFKREWGMSPIAYRTQSIETVTQRK